MSNGGIVGIGATIWGVIGVVVGLLDLLDVVRFGFISMTATQCAQSGNIVCLPGTIETMLLFLVDVITGPIILAANLMTNPFLGIVGVVLGLAVLYLSFGRSSGGGVYL